MYLQGPSPPPHVRARPPPRTRPMSLGLAGWVEVMLAGLVIGVDNLAAALALGALGQRARLVRIAAAFTVFGAIMPVVGALAGRGLAEAVAGVGAWLGAAVLAGLGGWMLVQAVRESGGEAAAERVTGGRGLFLLAATLSLDNLAVGFGLGVGGTPPWAIGFVGGLSVFGLTVLGLRAGDAARVRWQRYAHLTGAALLLALALAMALGWV